MRFLFGPAGSGKTFRCLAEIREELVRSPEGLDLILIAPKQATFQLERQLLSDERVSGYTRLQILSFERLAAYLFDRLGRHLPELLSEEGRVMVLRAILEEKQESLRIFRASARLSGFARHLSMLLRELQRHRIGPRGLDSLAAKEKVPPWLADKLSDLALILRAYQDWVGDSRTGGIEDAPRLLDVAVDALRNQQPQIALGPLWLDGFAEMTPQEQSLLAAVLPCCERATLAFCLPQAPKGNESWLSPWALMSETAKACHSRVSDLPNTQVEVETIERDLKRSRFAGNPMLAQLERVFAGDSGPGGPGVRPGIQASDTATELRQYLEKDGEVVKRGPTTAGRKVPISALRLFECSGAETEAMLAAREILQFVREGGRYRDCAVLVRSLEGYQDVLRRVLTRYGIPFFLDRRETVSHHPLAELTRFALRTVAHDWRQEDWLGVLKTGLAGLRDHEVDRLENAALARGWQGAALWLQPLLFIDKSPGDDLLEDWRARVTEPFAKLHQQLHQAGYSPSGAALVAQVRALWRELKVEARLQDWERLSVGGSVHATVWEQMNGWLDNLERAFRGVSISLREWLQIIEAGLSELSVGVIPPALDQVLVGSVDRSRNPDLKFALVLGVNESVFPAPPQGLPLLSESDVAALETNGVHIGPGRRQFGHERYLGYIALTRARQRVLVTWSAADAQGRPQNPSWLVDEIQRALPGIEVQRFDGTVPWSECQHPDELARMLLIKQPPVGLEPLHQLPVIERLVRRWQQMTAALAGENLSPTVAAELYGDELNLSVSALEQFAACPFQFFIRRGLRAQERDEFAVDARRLGEFQHAVLAEFHRWLKRSGKRWRELESDEAVKWVRELGAQQLDSYQTGLFRATALREFQARALIRNLERVVTQLTVWSRQNDFEPEAVEASFGVDPDGWTAWTLDLGRGRRVRVRGRVDRLDLLRLTEGVAAVAILDYKSGGMVFDDLKFEAGLQLQMPVYLNAICDNPQAREEFNAAKLVPAGMFYVGLRVKPEPSKSREKMEAAGEKASSEALQHRGRFDENYLKSFDNRGQQSGNQFKYRYTKKGMLHRTGNDVLPSQAFAELLDNASRQIRDLSGRILAGEAAVSPYQKGREVACRWCGLQSVCRFDMWTQTYRLLKRKTLPVGEEETD